MTQRHLEVLGFYLQQKTHISQTRRLLLEQSNFDSQVHEAIGKLISRHQPTSKTATIQKLHTSYNIIRILAVVLQQSSFIVPHESPG